MQVVRLELSRLARLDATQLRVRKARLRVDELLSLTCPRCHAGFAMQATYSSSLLFCFSLLRSALFWLYFSSFFIDSLLLCCVLH